MSDARPGFSVREIGEIVLRARDLPAMRQFYVNVVGLEPFADFPADGMCFLGISDGYGGHKRVLALFDAACASTREGHGWGGHDASQSPMHHFALTIDKQELDAAGAHLEDAGIAFNRRDFGWVGWRSVFFTDPEGNVVELVSGGWPMTA